jgi:hypothetical protein
MSITEVIGSMERVAFNAMFSADWLLGPKNLSKLLPRRWERLNNRLLSRAARAWKAGSVLSNAAPI